jgi:hypothetical protein
MLSERMCHCKSWGVVWDNVSLQLLGCLREYVTASVGVLSERMCHCKSWGVVWDNVSLQLLGYCLKKCHYKCCDVWENVSLQVLGCMTESVTTIASHIFPIHHLYLPSIRHYAVRVDEKSSLTLSLPASKDHIYSVSPTCHWIIAEFFWTAMRIYRFVHNFLAWNSYNSCHEWRNFMVHSPQTLVLREGSSWQTLTFYT